MRKQHIIDAITEHYSSFTDYIAGLSSNEYGFRIPNKWNAAQQLDHIIMCVKPLVQVFSMDKEAIGKSFGSTDRSSRSYDIVLTDYLEKLKAGGKAPARFVPETSLPEQKDMAAGTLTQLVKDLCSKLETFTEQELDTLCVPHPLLGSLTLREMLYNVMYHVQHHHEATKANLNQSGHP